MRNLVVCCDGTWNTPDQMKDGLPTPTNVVRLYNIVAAEDNEHNAQLKYYHPGVGTDGNWWDRLKGGGFGAGLSRNIMSAYMWLADHYQKDDRIFLFGFSRGAYTVRSLAGMISRCGLVDLSKLADDNARWEAVEQAYACYREGNTNILPGARDVTIHFLGVWDTVGALGIPRDLAILSLFDNPDKYSFHDTNLSKKVENARHALALDEMRATFLPTVWTGVENHPDVKQVWFPGVHCDVGGGYLEKGLSDGALQWMIDEAAQCGLGFHVAMSKQVAPNPMDFMHDSRQGFFKNLKTQPRNIPCLAPAAPMAEVHPSVYERIQFPPIAQAPYRPTFALTPGQPHTLPIYANEPWNYTGIYLEAGRQYNFTAQGQWVDRTIKCAPDGTTDKHFHIEELLQGAMSLWGKLEEVYKTITRNQLADFYGTRRVEEQNWFALIGAIGNGVDRHAGASTEKPDPADLSPMEIFPIGNGCNYKPQASGYLYCFANDAWFFYDNNHGSVMLTITMS